MDSTFVPDDSILIRLNETVAIRTVVLLILIRSERPVLLTVPKNCKTLPIGYSHTYVYLIWSTSPPTVPYALPIYVTRILPFCDARVCFVLFFLLSVEFLARPGTCSQLFVCLVVFFSFVFDLEAFVCEYVCVCCGEALALGDAVLVCLCALQVTVCCV